MLPKESTAGLATGCRLSAMGMPMSQVQASLVWSPAGDHQFAVGSALRNAHDDEGIGTDDHRRVDFADGDAGPVRFREALPPHLQFTAGDGGRGSYLRNLRPSVRCFPNTPYSIKIEPSRQK